jgi:hypothetical protein
MTDKSSTFVAFNRDVESSMYFHHFKRNNIFYYLKQRTLESSNSIDDRESNKIILYSYKPIF